MVDISIVFMGLEQLCNWGAQPCLVGGLDHFLFSIIYGIILSIDFHIFQDGYCTTNQYIPFPLIFHDQYSIVRFPINNMVITYQITYKIMESFVGNPGISW